MSEDSSSKPPKNYVCAVVVALGTHVSRLNPRLSSGKIQLIVVQTSNQIKRQSKSLAAISVAVGQNLKYLELAMYMLPEGIPIQNGAGSFELSVETPQLSVLYGACPILQRFLIVF